MLNLPFASWWFRGFMDRPTCGEVVELPAGGDIMLEHACHLGSSGLLLSTNKCLTVGIAWTSMAPLAGGLNTTTEPGSHL